MLSKLTSEPHLEDEISEQVEAQANLIQLGHALAQAKDTQNWPCVFVCMLCAQDCTVTISHGNFHGRITFETREAQALDRSLEESLNWKCHPSRTDQRIRYTLTH